MNRTGTGKYETLLERCRNFEPVPTAVAHPCEQSALAGPLEAAEKGLITPILVGPKAKIAEVAERAGLRLGKTEIVDEPHSHAAATKAVELVREGRAELLMKGACTRTSCCLRSSRARAVCARDAASVTSSSWMCRRITRCS